MTDRTGAADTVPTTAMAAGTAILPEVRAAARWGDEARHRDTSSGGTLGARTPSTGNILNNAGPRAVPAGPRAGQRAGPGLFARSVTAAGCALARWYRAGQLGPEESLAVSRWTGARC